MYSMNCCDGSVAAVAVIAQEETSPNWAGSVPSGPVMAATTPVFLAKNSGSFLHSVQLGLASLRNEASSSSRKVDQIAIADCPAKYAARTVSTSWVPETEYDLIRSP